MRPITTPCETASEQAPARRKPRRAGQPQVKMLPTVSRMSGLPDEARYVVMHIAPGPSRAEKQNGPPLITDGGRFILSDEIWIERLDEELAKDIQEACEPPHRNIGTHRYDRHLYAFVSRVPNVEKSSFEGMSRLHAVVALSRLVNPTSAGDRYCVLVYHYGMKNSGIFSIRFRGISPDITLITDPRDWLSVEDGKVLRTLMPWISGKMHPRVHRAYWNHEYAMRSYYLDARWTSVVSGLEALMNVGDQEVSWQFRDRVRQLAEEFQIGLSDDDLLTSYRLRSKLVHAEGFLFDLETILPKSQHSDLYGRLELLLRSAVKRCLLDESFGNFFSDDAAVKRRWRLSAKPTLGARFR